MRKSKADPAVVEQRFWDKVDQRSLDECWEWEGATYPYGYGAFWFEGSIQPAHRVAYKLTWGMIRPFRSHNVLRTCGNILCCNPDHLTLGSLKDAHALLGIDRRSDLRTGKRYLTTRQKRRIKQRALRGDSIVRIHRDYPNIHYSTVLKYAHEALDG